MQRNKYQIMGNILKIPLFFTNLGSILLVAGSVIPLIASGGDLDEELGEKLYSMRVETVKPSIPVGFVQTEQEGDFKLFILQQALSENSMLDVDILRLCDELEDLSKGLRGARKTSYKFNIMCANLLLDRPRNKKARQLALELIDSEFSSKFEKDISQQRIDAMDEAQRIRDEAQRVSKQASIWSDVTRALRTFFFKKKASTLEGELIHTKNVLLSAAKLRAHENGLEPMELEFSLEAVIAKKRLKKKTLAQNNLRSGRAVLKSKCKVFATAESSLTAESS